MLILQAKWGYFGPPLVLVRVSWGEAGLSGQSSQRKKYRGVCVCSLIDQMDLGPSLLAKTFQSMLIALLRSQIQRTRPSRSFQCPFSIVWSPLLPHVGLPLPRWLQTKDRLHQSSCTSDSIPALRNGASLCSSTCAMWSTTFPSPPPHLLPPSLHAPPNHVTLTFIHRPDRLLYAPPRLHFDMTPPAPPAASISPCMLTRSLTQLLHVLIKVLGFEEVPCSDKSFSHVCTARRNGERGRQRGAERAGPAWEQKGQEWAPRTGPARLLAHLYRLFLTSSVRAERRGAGPASERALRRKHAKETMFWKKGCFSKDSSLVGPICFVFVFVLVNQQDQLKKTKHPDRGKGFELIRCCVITFLDIFSVLH